MNIIILERLINVMRHILLRVLQQQSLHQEIVISEYSVHINTKYIYINNKTCCEISSEAKVKKLVIPTLRVLLHCYYISLLILFPSDPKYKTPHPAIMNNPPTGVIGPRNLGPPSDKP